MARLTKRLVDSISTSTSDLVLWDDTIKGFGLRVHPSGRKTYIVKCRSGARQFKITIGPHGPITAEKARNRARSIIEDAKTNPRFSRDLYQAKQSTNMKDLGKKFLDEHVATHCKKATQVDYRRCIEKLVYPKLGMRNVTDIERKDIVALHHGLRNTPYHANRTIAVLSKMFSLAEICGLRPEGSNPCRGLKRYREQGRERFLSGVEMNSLGQVLEKENANSPYVVAAIRLLLLTGARLNEILSLRWDYIDFENSTIRLPDSKTGAKLIHLSRPAMEILELIPQINGNPYVICGQRRECPLVNLQKPWREIRKSAELEDVRLHDLRHSYASVAAARGLSLPIIGKLLGHTQAQTTARYAHLASGPVREAADIVATALSEALSGKNQNSANRSGKNQNSANRKA